MTVQRGHGGQNLLWGSLKDDLGVHITEIIQWVPEEVDVKKNEMADALAQKALLMGPKPFCCSVCRWFLREDFKKKAVVLLGLRASEDLSWTFIIFADLWRPLALVKIKFLKLTVLFMWYYRFRRNFNKLQRCDSTCKLCRELE